MKDILAFQVNVRYMDDFVEELLRTKVDKIYRSIKSSGNVVYTCWSPEAKSFVTCTFVIPEVAQLNNYDGEYRDMHDSYSRSSWQFKGGHLVTEPSSKRNFVRALKALGASPATIKEYTKISVRKIYEQVELGTGDKDEELMETQQKESSGKLNKIISVDWHNGLVKEIRATFGIIGHCNSLSYRLAIEDWDEIRRQLVQQHEKCFEKLPNVEVVMGGIKAI